MSSTPKLLRTHLVQGLAKIPDPILLPLSGGVDSTSLLFAALAAKREVVATSFMLDGRMSTDFSVARSTASRFGVEFHPIFLPNDLKTLEQDVSLLVQVYGCRKKTDIECCWPFLYVRKLAEQGFRSIVSGYHADVYFGLSRKASVAGCTKDVKIFDEFRASKIAEFPNQQVRSLRKILPVEIHFPYSSDFCKSLFLGRSWDSLNKPKQKAPIRMAFAKEFARSHVRPHSNLQLGDSGISKHFEILLSSENLNPGDKYSSVVGVYNELARHVKA